MEKLIEKFNRKIDDSAPLTINPEHSRRIDYLRISVTDRCNLRCVYCMPSSGIETVTQNELLTFEEIIRLVKILVGLGIRRIRLTGGEPLVRKGIVALIERISDIKGVEDISLTTNGILLASYARLLRKAGLKGINISLDTLNPEKFRIITGSDSLSGVLEGIKIARQEGFLLKLNMVVMRGENDDEIINFVKFTLDNNLILRFIEFMNVTPLWKEDYFIPIEEVKDICEKEFGLRKADYKSFGPAQYYQIKDGMIGFIKTSIDNCKGCSRLRLTSTGELKLCLYQSGGVSLRDLLRKGENDNYIMDILRDLFCLKDDVDYRRWQRPQIYMCSVGG